jgi:hypothetical protein
MVSRIARPAVIEPPGELMYSEISFSGSSAARNSIWAITRLATLSSMGVPRKMMFSLSKPRVDVERALAARSLLHHHRDQDGILHDSFLLHQGGPHGGLFRRSFLTCGGAPTWPGQLPALLAECLRQLGDGRPLQILYDTRPHRLE